MSTAPILEIFDPLAELLGAHPPDGCFRYTYADAVRLAGHSCPTVAGAYLMACAALRALYPNSRPIRGEVEVIIGGAPDDDRASGPVSQVVTLLTGAAGDNGFGGLAGLHRRRGLLAFAPELDGRIRFHRRDTGATVDVRYQPEQVPFPKELRILMTSVLGGRATPEERARFRELWTQRVADILAYPARVVQVEHVEKAA